jgi:hypothetical protein
VVQLKVQDKVLVRQQGLNQLRHLGQVQDKLALIQMEMLLDQEQEKVAQLQQVTIVLLLLKEADKELLKAPKESQVAKDKLFQWAVSVPCSNYQ